MKPRANPAYDAAVADIKASLKHTISAPLETMEKVRFFFTNKADGVTDPSELEKMRINFLVMSEDVKPQKSWLLEQAEKNVMPTPKP